jgi:hypothetical protein
MNCEVHRYRFAIHLLLLAAVVFINANFAAAQIIAVGPNAPREVTAVVIPPPGYFAALKLYQAGQYHRSARC